MNSALVVFCVVMMMGDGIYLSSWPYINVHLGIKMLLIEDQGIDVFIGSMQSSNAEYWYSCVFAGIMVCCSSWLIISGKLNPLNNFVKFQYGSIQKTRSSNESFEEDGEDEDDDGDKVDEEDTTNICGESSAHPIFQNHCHYLSLAVISFALWVTAVGVESIQGNDMENGAGRDMLGLFGPLLNSAAVVLTLVLLVVSSTIMNLTVI